MCLQGQNDHLYQNYSPLPETQITCWIKIKYGIYQEDGDDAYDIVMSVWRQCDPLDRKLLQSTLLTM